MNKGAHANGGSQPKHDNNRQKSEMIAHLAFTIYLSQLLNNLDDDTTVQVLCAVLA